MQMRKLKIKIELGIKLPIQKKQNAQLWSVICEHCLISVYRYRELAHHTSISYLPGGLLLRTLTTSVNVLLCWSWVACVICNMPVNPSIATL